MDHQPTLYLNDGKRMPMLTFGTGTIWYEIHGRQGLNRRIDRRLVEVLKKALRHGFRHLDCAETYFEREIGWAIKESGIPREDLFITTKIGDGWDDVEMALEFSLDRLQVEYVDLCLLHSPGVIEKIQDPQAA
ncbi:NADP-dependent oxidoreductase domain-containing protein [Xylariaceae sp. FL0016]|nr:NADP-dependent oxidoreductase domain-containing protein [Xylariaceae sp. FL0016]